MSWLVDNATTVYVLLSIITAVLVVLFWLDKRVKFLIWAGLVVALIGLFWFATRYFDSDGKQLKNNVLAMRDAVVAGNVDDLFEHVSEDFRYKELNRDTLYKRAQKVLESNQIEDVNISAFRIEKISRANGSARTWFRVTARTKGQEEPHMFTTQCDFVLEGNRWKLITMRFFNPVVDQDREIDIPGLR